MSGSQEGSQAGEEQPKNVLKLETILPCLSMIDKTVGRLASFLDGSSYAYVKLIIEVLLPSFLGEGNRGAGRRH